MSRIRGRDTGPEVRLRHELWAAGRRYRLHARDVPGTPDICNRRRKVAIFVDGCFWHGCPEHFRVPKTRTEFWREKIRRNQAKREAVRRQLDDWTVIEVFECELKSNLGDVVKRVVAAWPEP